jgi:hypothetical protein
MEIGRLRALVVGAAGKAARIKFDLTGRQQESAIERIRCY